MRLSFRIIIVVFVLLLASFPNATCDLHGETGGNLVVLAQTSADGNEHSLSNTNRDEYKDVDQISDESARSKLLSLGYTFIWYGSLVLFLALGSAFVVSLPLQFCQNRANGWSFTFLLIIGVTVTAEYCKYLVPEKKDPIVFSKIKSGLNEFTAIIPEPFYVVRYPQRTPRGDLSTTMLMHFDCKNYYWIEYDKLPISLDQNQIDQGLGSVVERIGQEKHMTLNENNQVSVAGVSGRDFSGDLPYPGSVMRGRVLLTADRAYMIYVGGRSQFTDSGEATSFIQSLVAGDQALSAITAAASPSSETALQGTSRRAPQPTAKASVVPAHKMHNPAQPFAYRPHKNANIRAHKSVAAPANNTGNWIDQVVRMEKQNGIH